MSRHCPEFNNSCPRCQLHIWDEIEAEASAAWADHRGPGNDGSGPIVSTERANFIAGYLAAKGITNE